MTKKKKHQIKRITAVQSSHKRQKLNECIDKTRPFVLLQNHAHVRPDRHELSRLQVAKKLNWNEINNNETKY